MTSPEYYLIMLTGDGEEFGTAVVCDKVDYLPSGAVEFVDKEGFTAMHLSPGLKYWFEQLTEEDYDVTVKRLAEQKDAEPEEEPAGSFREQLGQQNIGWSNV